MTAPFAQTTVAFVGLDLARFLGWASVNRDAVFVVRDAMGLSVTQPVLECPAGEEESGTLALLQNPAVLSFLREHGVENILVFKPSFRVQQWVESQGFSLMAGDCGIAQRLENKIQFADLAKACSLPIPPCSVYRKGLPSWSEVTGELGGSVVLQKARGILGRELTL